ncbi:DUF3606 domain-containing protein [Piscinibacter sakaiensis]|uniref:DUF3606 domain-containing protein n=1 Tax=Piscinibacter sakaiensis TaxID=1547922 RepID=A0A0K8NWM3_PISS1|nr:DUF3606 domain-containing protein [Piscinibacter sakaiensis]GAP34674.1 hypothetical protein ISF6_5382 [Piscinibacter sakaiensis]
MQNVAPTATDAPLGERIDVNAHYEVREWAARFGVTPERLREAVRAVGVWSADVESYLKRPPPTQA